MKALLVSYYYPPIGTSGTIRIVKFVKYLKTLGCTCSVLTIKNVVNQTLDQGLEKEIPQGTQVYRTFHIEPRTFYRQNPGSQIISGPPSFAQQLKKEVITGLQKIIKFILLPDELIFWAPSAIYRGIRIVQRDKIDVIISSSPPPTVHIIAYFIKTFTGVPWVTDFRDEWTTDPFNRPPTGIHRAISSGLENLVLKNASAVTVVTPAIFDEMKQQRAIQPGKFSVIPNGFDEEDIPENSTQIARKKLTITYSGSFYQHRTPFHFLQALKELSSEGLVDLNEIKFIVYGTVGQDCFGIKIIKDPMLQKVISIRPYQSHDQLFSLLLNTDLLLLVISNQSGLGSYSGKLFEYLGARRFIFGLIPTSGLAAEIIRQTKTGIVIDPEQIPLIKSGFLKVYQQWRSDKNLQLDPEESEISKYTRRHQAEQLFHIFEGLTSNQPK